MDDQRYTIELPEEMVQDLDLKQEDVLHMKVDNKKIIIEPKKKKTTQMKKSKQVLIFK